METEQENKIKFDININEIAEIVSQEMKKHYGRVGVTDWDAGKSYDVKIIDKNNLKNKQEQHYSKDYIDDEEQLRLVMTPLEISLQLYKEIKDKKETKDVFRERGKVYFTPNIEKICVQAAREDDKLMSNITEKLRKYSDKEIVYIAPVIEK